ncbi:hypothetical protein QTP70_024568 [Hemibagrus guttatus]|uniref:Uncharacterized protein n=1 Tax=Hemibagrus guttatus TaxID=175788 RepID=A0AAE0R131_9TELE|nr:hypothetical protein QTP70_024568 [Hemibagrus guttatus]
MIPPVNMTQTDSNGNSNESEKEKERAPEPSEPPQSPTSVSQHESKHGNTCIPSRLSERPNKSDKIQLLTRTIKDFLNSAALCFMETWLNGAILNSALHPNGLPASQSGSRHRVVRENVRRRACFDLTDWSVFEAAFDTVTSYISFCEDMRVPSRTYLTFNNDKPWFSAKLKQFRHAKEDAYRSGDKALYKQAKYTLNRELRVAKPNYSEKLKKQLSSNDSTSVWKGLKDITSYRTPSPSTEANQQLAEDLNKCYCRFEKQKPGLTPYTRSDHLTTWPSTPSPSLPPTVPQPVLKICEDDVCKVFSKRNIRKAKGPEGVPKACLKACAVQLSSIFNRSLELCEVSSCFKRSTIIPAPKKPKITGLNPTDLLL